MYYYDRNSKNYNCISGNLHSSSNCKLSKIGLLYIMFGLFIKFFKVEITISRNLLEKEKKKAKSFQNFWKLIREILVRHLLP